MRTPISLVIFDGDDTLWYGLDGGYISGVDYQDPGRNDYTFHNLDHLHIQRSDGQRFRLYTEVPSLFPELRRRGVLLSLASYNHPAPTLGALRAFGLDSYLLHPVVEFHSHKDRMLQAILQDLAQDGYVVQPENTLLIDDDRTGNYRLQMAGMGVNFLQKDVDIHDLGDLLDHPHFELQPLAGS